MKNYIKFPCPICHNKVDPIFKIKDRFNIILYISICKNDGLIFLNPRWSNEQYDRYYLEGYDKMKRKQIFEKVKDNRKLYKRGRSIYKRVKSFCRSPKSILDVGAGNGYILDFLRDVFKTESFFIEPSIECQKQILSRGHKYITFQTDKKFDLITSRHVLEHVNDPIDYLKSIRNLMDDNTIFHISFPNSQNMAKAWFQVPHIYYFDESIFRLIAGMIGLKIIKYESGKNELWFILKKCDSYKVKIKLHSYEDQINKIIKASKIKKCQLDDNIIQELWENNR